MLTVMGDHEKFVSELIFPIALVAPTVIGEPGIPIRFRWRGAEYEIARVVEKWKTTGDCWHGSGERYVRRHWYRVIPTDGTEMKIYFERQARSKQQKKRWWLATTVSTSDVKTEG
jgi:phosphoribosylglycinamide formyltransferase-1